MLKAWRPQKRPQFTAMMPLNEPDGEYWSLEAMKAFAIGWKEWASLPPQVRGRLIAHEIETTLRKGYSEERAHLEAEAEAKVKEKGGKPNAWTAMQRMMFGNGEQGDHQG